MRTTVGTRLARFALRSRALCAVSILLAPTVGFAQADLDADGVLDDGDFSGSAYDNPCPTGGASGCDDNCRAEPNPLQTDDLAPFGVGDDCHSTPQDVSSGLQNGQFLDVPDYRWRTVAASFEPPAVAETIPLPIDAGVGGSCTFVQIDAFGPVVGFSLPPAPPFGGLACCPWQARCSVPCAEFGTPKNDCDPAVDCSDDASATQRACSQVVHGTDDLFSLQPEQLDELSVELQDPDGQCAGIPGIPFDACCFSRTEIVAYFWGSEANNPAASADADGDGHVDACDVCPADVDFDQTDADGDGRGAACDVYAFASPPFVPAPDESRWVCGDVDADGCDDCSYGHFDPSFDGEVNPPDGQCVPEPGTLPMLVAGVGALLLLHQRHARRGRER